MRIVITGGAGFLGTRLARQRCSERGTLVDAGGRQQTISSLVLLDVVPPATAWNDKRVSAVTGDLADPAVIERAVTSGTASIFHLAAVVSGQAEADFDIGMRVNLDATRLLLERCRKLAAPPKLVFTSSLAVFGGPVPDPVPDDAPVTPQASYGAQKVIGEYLVYDMTRKGFIDGRSLRLPTVTVRPGKTRPRRRSRAASSASPCRGSTRRAPSRRRRGCGCSRRARSSTT
jgi:nucleoside-diphosphate-sugar epimerase